MPTEPTLGGALHVDLVIKEPSSATETPLRLSVPLDGTVRDIKVHLSRAHPEHPCPSDQRLIFAGKLLTDSSRTADVLKQVGIPPRALRLSCPASAGRSLPWTPAMPSFLAWSLFWRRGRTAMAPAKRPPYAPHPACRSATSLNRKRSTSCCPSKSLHVKGQRRPHPPAAPRHRRPGRAGQRRRRPPPRRDRPRRAVSAPPPVSQTFRPAVAAAKASPHPWRSSSVSRICLRVRRLCSESMRCSCCCSNCSSSPGGRTWAPS